ncbi:MAG: O-antigen ligase family protein, partial [Gemmatimonadales bacterium]
MVLVVAAAWERPDILNRLARAAMAAACLVSLYVLVQAADLDWQTWTADFRLPDYPGSTLGNSNFAGGYIAVALPLSIFVTLRARPGRPRAALATLCGVQGLALFYTGTRGGMLGALAGVVAMVLIARRDLPSWAAVAAGGSVAAVLLACVLVVWHPGLGQAPGPLARVSTSTLENRVRYWGAAWRIFGDHPLHGTGPDTFYAYYPKYRPEADAVKNTLAITDKPHNIFLEYAAAAGVPGIVTYLALLALAFGYGMRRLRSAGPDERLLLVCLLGALVAYCVQGFFSIDVPSSAFMGWMVLGAIAALADPGVLRSRHRLEATATKAPMRLSTRWMIHTATAAGTVGLLLVGSRPLRADVEAHAGRLEAAMALQPLEAEYRSRAGDLERSIAVASTDPAERVRHLRKAQEHSLAARSLQPGNFDYSWDLARVNSIWAMTIDTARFPEAERWWRRALADDPRDPAMAAEHRRAVAEMRARAAELEGLAMLHNDANAWAQAATAYRGLGDTERA